MRSEGADMSFLSAGRHLSMPRKLPEAVAIALQPIAAALQKAEFIPQYEIVGDIAEPHRQAALQAIREAMKSAPPEEIDQELVRLRLSTKSREETTDDLAMTYEIYAELCAEYPAEAVRDGLRCLAREETFWPALAEVKFELDAQSAALREIREVLEHPEEHRAYPRYRS